MADEPITADEKAKGDRAMAALETMAVTWCAQHGLGKAVADVLSAVKSGMPGANERAQRILMGLIVSAHMEGLYEGRTSPREMVRLTTEEVKALTMPWRDLGWALRAVQRGLAEKNGARLVEPGGAPVVPARAAREHQASLKCWCEPELHYKDPETGACVYVHRDLQ